MQLNLLSKPQDNPKVSKNMGIGVFTTVLHLAPYNLSGFNVCPMASKGCATACLHTAGNPAFQAQKNKGRIRKTIMFYKEREKFMDMLAKDIVKIQKKGYELGYEKIGIRLNGTSDIPFERVPIQGYDNIMQLFPDIIFYDYTKRYNRKDLPSNYSLTFSLSEDNDKHAIQAYVNGMNIAIVFRKDKPETFTLGNYEIPVIDGDLHDFRPLDPKNVIVGLKAKGKARQDDSGFVRDTDKIAV